MCGIIGYKWKQYVPQVLLQGLERLEYRGYDSAGIAVIDREKKVHLWKRVGKVSALSQPVMAQKIDHVVMGIGHTRWATHGGVTEENCHPHISNDGKWIIAHNWIIENYLKLKQQLISDWFTFYSQTDTEVIVNLLQKNRDGDFLSTVQKTTKQLVGAYALLIINKDIPGEIIWVKLGSPLILAKNNQEDIFFSSDAQALAGYATELSYLEDGDIVQIKDNGRVIYSGDMPIQRALEELDQEALMSSKGDHKFFMEKEIYEQANIIKRICMGRVNFANMSLMADAFHGMQSEQYRKINIVACGTSYNSGTLAGLWIEDFAGIDSKSFIASEYENRPIVLGDDILHIFISQSGETADSIACLKQIKERGGKTFGVVNVAGSSIARMTDSGLFTRAGTEIGVASTKAFVAQAICLLLLSLFLGQKRGMRISRYNHILQELQSLPLKIDEVLAQSDYIRDIANQLKESKSMFFLGRGVHVPIAYESALKLKEISYIHAEAYPAGELKHGPLALIDKDFPTVLFLPDDELFEKNIWSLHEIKARDGKILAVSDREIPQADRQITLPSTCPELMPILSVVAGQLLAYHIADLLGRDIDKPRNLAKSVTVK
jgi:glucosamine--fructose-6-phosphate aminotransferase (isomerizing)